MNKVLLDKIKLLANPYRLQIIELTQEKEYSITELSSKLNLTYTKCADYVTMLYNSNLVDKTKQGKEVKIRSKIKVSDKKIVFNND